MAAIAAIAALAAGAPDAACGPARSGRAGVAAAAAEAAGAAAAGAALLRQLLVDGSRGNGSGGLEEPHRSIEFQSVEVEGYFRWA